MNLEELQKIAEKDMKIDKDNLDIESLKIPELQHKYLKFHSNYNLLLKQKEVRSIHQATVDHVLVLSSLGFE